MSTLALTRLPTPHSPPQDQQELLAATLQILVSFVVLGSIIIRTLSFIPYPFQDLTASFTDGLSIPSFSFGKRLHSRTVSLSRTWTSRQTTGPDWLLWARRAPDPHTGTATPAVDVESAAGEPVKKHNGESDAPVIRQADMQEITDTDLGTTVPLGPAAMLAEVNGSEDYDSSGSNSPTQTLRKRNLPVLEREDGDIPESSTPIAIVRISRALV